MMRIYYNKGKCKFVLNDADYNDSWLEVTEEFMNDQKSEKLAGFGKYDTEMIRNILNQYNN